MPPGACSAGPLRPVPAHRPFGPAPFRPSSTLRAHGSGPAGAEARFGPSRASATAVPGTPRPGAAARGSARRGAPQESSELRSPGTSTACSLQRGHRHDAQHGRVRRGQDDRGRDALGVGPCPVGRGHAPPIPGNEPGEAVLRSRRGQVVADPALLGEELGGHHGADRVAADILRPRAAVPVAEEPREGVGAARLQLSSEDVSLDHGDSIAPGRTRSARRGPRRVRAVDGPVGALRAAAIRRGWPAGWASARRSGASRWRRCGGRAAGSR